MALYHTYRPRTFDDVAYQGHVIETIKNQVINDKVAHAYLFAGPRGVGKTTTARILAKAVNLELKKGTAEFDDSSDTAKEINEGRSIDIIEIDAASHTGVDNVREHIIENARFHPTTLKKKVFIIDEVHMLSNSAFNALLKTLEEPPAHVMFILATTELHKIPETIISRCQVFRFKRVPFEEMKAHLQQILIREHVTVDDDVLERIINKSDGCVRDAMSLLDQVLATGETHVTKESVSMFLPTSDVSTTLAFLTALVQKNMHVGLDTIGTASNDGVRMEQFAHDTLELLRILMILKATGNYAGTGLDLSDATKDTLAMLEKSISHPELIRLTDMLMKRKSQLASSPIQEMPMEMVVLEWCTDSSPIVGITEGGTSHSQEATKHIHTAKESAAQQAEVLKTAPVPDATEKNSDMHSDTPTMNDAAIHNLKSEVSLDDVRRQWSTWISNIEADSPSLVFILKMASCTRVTQNTIVISVSYGFHRDKLMDLKVKKKIEELYSTLLGTPVLIEVEVNATSEATTPADTELTDLTAAFGGQVIG